MIGTPIIEYSAKLQFLVHAYNIIGQWLMAINGQVVIRPMMYVKALRSYDHRVIDGRESVDYSKTVVGESCIVAVWKDPIGKICWNCKIII
jgi:pyruvate/2-oxoglutarate dehydrogenase complex dihydrolipoamide acyltransferase (E2) component